MQRKWKSLRDSFNREINKQKKSGSGASARKEYIYFNQLSFLKRTQNVRPTTAEEITKNDTEQEQIEEETMSINSFTRKAKKRNIDKTENEILKQLSDNLKNKYATRENQDPDKDFLMSVLPDIKKIHDDFKIDFKAEMLQLIKKYKMYDPCQSYGSHGYSSQNPTYTTAQPLSPIRTTTSNSMSTSSALSNYSYQSTDDDSIIEDMFSNET